MASLTLNEVRGSRLRCLLLTGLPGNIAARTLTDLTDGNALVTEKDEWLPKGIPEPDEAKVHENFLLITPAQKQELLDWWLTIKPHANTPNWDIVSTCTIEEKPGLLLVEAKAHRDELSHSGKPSGNQANHDQIQSAIEDANTNLNAVLDGWKLQRGRSYQLANRFAWAWKLASIGIPVALVYLGFRNAEEMGKGAFATHADWKTCVLNHAAPFVPQSAWEQRLDIGGVPLFPLIRSLGLEFHP